jgi:hypothetical protein
MSISGLVYIKYSSADGMDIVDNVIAVQNHPLGLGPDDHDMRIEFAFILIKNKFRGEIPCLPGFNILNTQNNIFYATVTANHQFFGISFQTAIRLICIHLEHFRVWRCSVEDDGSTYRTTTLHATFKHYVLRAGRIRVTSPTHHHENQENHLTQFNR